MQHLADGVSDCGFGGLNAAVAQLEAVTSGVFSVAEGEVAEGFDGAEGGAAGFEEFFGGGDI